MSQYTIPSVVERRAGGGERVVDVFSRLLSERIVYLGTEIDDGVANVLVAQLLHLESENPDAPISLYINSPGGSASAALAVYDAMQYVRPPVTTTCVGQAIGPAALLLAGGTPGRRAILAHGRVVLHQPSAEGRGALPDLIVAAEEVARLRAELEGVLAHHTGKEPGALRRDTDRDLVLTAGQAVAYGVADHVVQGRVAEGRGR
ncbi:ClpP family protease [Actinotalea sp. C106]|uniref:ClpP family protease n=1 Tax=Actinotalea sp. C106 TaxID=2908644 RepID=UPI0020298F94|nr:ATP-dependent Clp protease proteolytic subunit [Actinotalea sp. C106]